MKIKVNNNEYDYKIIYVDKETHSKLKSKAAHEGLTLKKFMKELGDRI